MGVSFRGVVLGVSARVHEAPPGCVFALARNFNFVLLNWSVLFLDSSNSLINLPFSSLDDRAITSNYSCLYEPPILRGFFQVATVKSPLPPPVPAAQLSLDSRCRWKYFSRPNKATNPHTHTLPKIRPNPYAAACKEPCQSLATSGLKYMPLSPLPSISFPPAVNAVTR